MTPEKSGCRPGGRAYRRKMKRKHQKDLMRLILRSGYRPNIGYVDMTWVNGVVQPVGNHIKYPKNSKAQRYWKRHSNKLIRRRGEAWRGNQYRRCFEYQWSLY